MQWRNIASVLTLSTLVLSTLVGCSVKVGLPRTSGAFLDAVKGDTFEPIDTLDPRNAMVYIYRPDSEWGYEEVQAPTFFVESEQLFGLKSGGYEWLELHGGTYDFYARRPMGILFVKTIFELPINVEGGKNYYFRYSETKPIVIEEIADNPELYVQDGPLQQVPEAFALRELKHLRLDEPGIYYGGVGYEEPRWAPFWTFDDKDKVSKK
jgi:uncharacterized protein DUF2846